MEKTLKFRQVAAQVAVITLDDQSIGGLIGGVADKDSVRALISRVIAILDPKPLRGQRRQGIPLRMESDAEMAAVGIFPQKGGEFFANDNRKRRIQLYADIYQFQVVARHMESPQISRPWP